jgi:type I restriction enzyme S subunit
MSKLYGMKTSWKLIRLEELIRSVKPGFAVGDRQENGIIQVRMNNVDTEGNLDLTDCLRVPATPKQIAGCSLEQGDVLFNNTNSTELVGKTAVFRGHEEAVTFSNHFTRIRVDADRLDPFYLARWLTKQQQNRVLN